MAEVMRRADPLRWPDLLDWFDRGWPTLLRMPMPAEMGDMRVEDYVEGDRYVLRAELPGIDPEKDLEITVSDGMLSIRAERRQESKEGGRSEFRYGAFARTVALPAQAKADEITATYGDGILEVSVGLGEEPKKTAKRIPVAKA
jgi:HSP20 family molecular chaperone IbpA